MSPILCQDRSKELKREKYAVTEKGGGELSCLHGGIDTARCYVRVAPSRGVEDKNRELSHFWAGWTALAPSEAEWAQGTANNYSSTILE